jgi:integration host factor subunit beta
MMDISVYNSAIFSLIVQILIVILSICGLVIKLKPNDLILKEILLLETIVQIIEFSFYIWLIKNFSKIKVNVSLIRYFDWFITTPTMLFSLICFFIYQKYKTSGISTRDLSLKNIFFDTIANSLIAYKPVELRDFGRFSVKTIKAKYNARNPKTGEKVNVPEKYVPHFKAGKELRARVDK